MTNWRKIFFRVLLELDCSVSSITTLLNKYPSILNNVAVELDNYDPPLISAIVMNKEAGIIKELLNHGANIHEISKNGDTTLHCAARNPTKYQFDLIKALLDNGANVNAKNSLKQTPICVLLNNFRNEHLLPIFKLMYKHANSDIVAPILDVVISYSTTRCLLQLGCKMEEHRNTFELVNFLLESGVNFNIQATMAFTKFLYQLQDDCLINVKAIFQLIIQFVVIRNMDINTSVIAGEIDFIMNLRSDYDLCFFYDSCRVEIMQMKNDKISYNYSLYQFVSDFQHKISKISMEELYEVILRIIQNKYSYSKDIIFAAIRHRDLVEMKNSFPDDSLGFTPDSFRVIAEYLSKQDVINVIYASHSDIFNV